MKDHRTSILVSEEDRKIVEENNLAYSDLLRSAIAEFKVQKLQSIQIERLEKELTDKKQKIAGLLQFLKDKNLFNDFLDSDIYRKTFT